MRREYQQERQRPTYQVIVLVIKFVQIDCVLGQCRSGFGCWGMSSQSKTTMEMITFSFFGWIEKIIKHLGWKEIRIQITPFEGGLSSSRGTILVGIARKLVVPRAFNDIIWRITQAVREAELKPNNALLILS